MKTIIKIFSIYFMPGIDEDGIYNFDYEVSIISLFTNICKKYIFSIIQKLIINIFINIKILKNYISYLL